MKHRWSGVGSWCAIVLLLMSAGLNALQARRIRELVAPSSRQTAQVGKMAPALTGLTLSGQLQTIRFNDREPTVIYFFSPGCRWCEQNWANVRALSSASEGRFRLVAVAAESNLRDFARARDLNFEILENVSADTLKAFGLAATPHTLVISSQGQISHEWAGAFQGRRQRAIEAFFEVRLPGLLGPAKP